MKTNDKNAELEVKLTPFIKNPWFTITDRDVFIDNKPVVEGYGVDALNRNLAVEEFSKFQKEQSGKGYKKIVALQLMPSETPGEYLKPGKPNEEIDGEYLWIRALYADEQGNVFPADWLGLKPFTKEVIAEIYLLTYVSYSRIEEGSLNKALVRSVKGYRNYVIKKETPRRTMAKLQRNYALLLQRKQR